jgi:stringent starvation protein B
VKVPVAAVLAIYARETGQGMALPDDASASGPDEPPDPMPDTPGDEAGAARRGGHLRVVK